ncbi:hypothetical protein II582_03430 [bacterium]|nr:hypothetical protein [bacterium]
MPLYERGSPKGWGFLHRYILKILRPTINRGPPPFLKEDKILTDKL